MPNIRHTVALSAFEDDDQYDNIENKLCTFNTKQKKNSRATAKKFEWIEEERRLKQAEAAALKQLSNSINTALLGENEEEKSWIDTVECSKSASFQIVMEMRSKIDSISSQADTEHASGICAQLILYAKEELLNIGTELDAQYTLVETEVKVNSCRRKVLEMIAQDSKDGVSPTMSQRLATAISDARVLENKIIQLSETDADELGVSMFESEINQKLTALEEEFKQSRKPTKTESHEYTKRSKLIEDNAMKAIATLTKELERRHKHIVEQKKIGLKADDLRIRIQSQRIEQEKAAKKKNLKRLDEDSVIADANNKREMELLKSRISKHALRQHQATNKHDLSSLTAELQTEAARLSKHHSNKERTRIREEQRQHKLRCKEMSNAASAKAEERRLEKLCALAASVPYYKDIINATSDIHKTTEARKNDVHTSRDSSLAEFQRGELRSFTNDKVFSDSKFRLANALHEAGLAQSTYARNVVRNAIPRQEERTTGIQPY